MIPNSMKTKSSASIPFLVWAFSAVSLLVGLLVAISSYFNYQLSMSLRQEYLANEAKTIADYVDLQLRGPLRHNPEDLAQIAAEAGPRFHGVLLFLGIVDPSGQYNYHSEAKQIGQPAYHLHFATTAHQTASPSLAAQASEDKEKGIFVLSTPVLVPHAGGLGTMGRGGMGRGGPVSRILEVGIHTDIAQFILTQAHRQVMLSIITFLLLTSCAVVTPFGARRFLAMQKEQEKHRHWANMGRLSASMAHEIRNPLGAIKGLSQLLLERMKAETAEKDFAQTIVNETKRLEDLVHSLLSFARLPEPNKEPCDLAILVRQVLEDMRLELEKADIEVRLPPEQGEETALVDKSQIRQVLWNVFLNAQDAMKKEGGTLTVNFEAHRTKETITLSVRDSGSGLTPDAIQNLFEPFFTTKAQGNGLGLAISQQIIRRHGGKIRLENAPGGGAVCSISLPRG